MEQKDNKKAEAQKAKALKKEESRVSKGSEVFRFIVVGVLCTIIDFLVQYGFGRLFVNNLSLEGKVGDVLGWGSYVATAIGVTVGFLVSVIVNFIFSRKWVFQNVEKEKNFNTAAYFWKYTGLSFGGLLLGVALQMLMVWLCNATLGWQLTLDPYQVSMGEEIKKLFSNGSIQDWGFIIVFCIKTLVVLFYNYFTRKLLIFKEPKNNGMVDKAADSINRSVIGLTYSNASESFDKAPKEEPKEETNIIKEEPKPEPVLERASSPAVTVPPEPKKEPEQPSRVPAGDIGTIYCEPQFDWGKPVNKKSAEQAIFASLETFDPRKSSVTDVKTVKKIIVKEVKKVDEEKKIAKRKGK